MTASRNTNGGVERLTIQEKALSNMADTLRKQELAFAEEIHDLQAEVKALKVFLARNMPEFKQQFPEIQRKVK